MIVEINYGEKTVKFEHLEVACIFAIGIKKQFYMWIDGDLFLVFDIDSESENQHAVLVNK